MLKLGTEFADPKDVIESKFYLSPPPIIEKNPVVHFSVSCSSTVPPMIISK